YEGFNTFQARDPHRSANFIHLSIRAYVNDLVESGKAEVLHQADLRSQAIIVGRDRAALERVHEFRGVEAEDLQASEVANHPSGVAAAECVRRIEHQV